MQNVLLRSSRVIILDLEKIKEYVFWYVSIDLVIPHAMRMSRY